MSMAEPIFDAGSRKHRARTRFRRSSSTTRPWVGIPTSRNSTAKVCSTRSSARRLRRHCLHCRADSRLLIPGVVRLLGTIEEFSSSLVHGEVEPEGLSDPSRLRPHPSTQFPFRAACLLPMLRLPPVLRATFRSSDDAWVNTRSSE